MPDPELRGSRLSWVFLSSALRAFRGARRRSPQAFARQRAVRDQRFDVQRALEQVGAAGTALEPGPAVSAAILDFVERGVGDLQGKVEFSLRILDAEVDGSKAHRAGDREA